MKINKITCAVLAALAVTRMSHAADDATPASTSSLETVTVTAQRSSENMQDVPITIQAFTGETLKELHVSTMDDVVKYLPNVQFATNGPGQGNIYMRGLSTGMLGNQSSATIAPFPNVAVYLDDQSMQFPARNLDIYMVDMERLEVLEGPQGTLFGGGAEAGAIRYITNKPQLDKTSGGVNAGYGVTASGDPNNSLNAVLNLPLTDSIALRGVIYNDHRGGYIDNVPGTYTRNNNDIGNIAYSNFKPGANSLCPNGLPSNTGYCTPPNGQSANNNSVARKNWNPTDYNGARASALWKINDDWDLLIAQSYQNMDSEGQATTYPISPDGQPMKALQITSFVPSFDKDRYSNTSWTLNGKFGVLNAVYTGGFTDRHIEQQQDYTNYSRSPGGIYYSCVGGNTGWGSSSRPLSCYSPIGYWHDQVKNTHWSHEIRLSTPDDWRLRGIGGVYYENFHIYDNMNFNYKTIPSCTPANLAAALAGGAPCVGNIGPDPNSTVWQPGTRSDSTAFGEDAQRGYKQIAAFGSASYDIIENVLTATVGTRYYHYSNFQVGSQYGTGTNCLNVANGACNGATNMDAENLHNTYHGFKSRANLVWHIDADQMLYYTFSQGFRPGAFNRTVKAVAPGPDGKQYMKPHGYAPDSLTNNEIGYKGEFLDNHLMLNASLYHMHWNNVQMQFFNPLYLGNTTFGVNGPNYKVNGLELQGSWRVTDAFSLQGAGSWNHASQINSPCLIDNIAGTAAFGKCITQVVILGQLQPFVNPFGAKGTPPAFSPKAEYNLRARYDWAFNGYKAYAMVGANYTGSMYNQPATYPSGDGVVYPTTVGLRYLQPSYTTYDASINIAGDNWNATLYGSNLSNSHASVFTSSAEFIKSEVPIRPRVIGVNFGIKF